MKNIFYISFLMLLLLAGCASQEVHYDDRPFHERSHRQESNDFVVEAAALSWDESKAVFGVALNQVNVQPVWLKIINLQDEPHLLFPGEIDHNYFPAYEVANRASKISNLTKNELFQTLRNNQIDVFIPPAGTHSGFVYTHNDEGMKAFTVDLHGPSNRKSFNFVVPVPGLPSDYIDVDIISHFQHLTTDDMDDDELYSWLKSLNCCAVNDEGKKGDPLNIVFIGNPELLYQALIKRHWDVTAPVSSSSLKRMLSAFFFGSRYRYAPISPLYVFGREQDLAFQKARTIIDERNHMRIWLAPVTYQGKPVWVGQVSRDVGIKFSGKFWPPTTHVIDPDTDDARFYVLQDLLSGNSIEKMGFVKIHQKSTISEPHYNAEDDPYFTDGLTNVFFLADDIVPISDVKVLDWTLPDVMSPYREFYIDIEEVETSNID